MAAQQKENDKREAAWADIGAELQKHKTPEDRAPILVLWEAASDAHFDGVAVKRRMVSRHSEIQKQLAQTGGAAE
eukprot:1183126-Heterocapsa_arctica.AAC.1